MQTFSDIQDTFSKNLRTVEDLVSFDKLILDTCISHIQSLNIKLRNGPFKIDNPNYLAENTLMAIKNIRSNNSLRFNYLSMFNSCLVLQVSYFTSAVDDIFKLTTSHLIATNSPKAVDFEMLRKKNEINFQNMYSLTKTFRKFLDVEIAENSEFNTLTMAQCARHAIVHSLGIADEKFIQQTNQARPRDIKKQFYINEKIQFSESELEYVRMAMLQFVSQLCDKIQSKYDIE